MYLKKAIRTALAAALLAGPAFAGDAISIDDAYARSASKVAKSGAIFMTIHNAGDADDRVIAARTDAAKKAELHTHIGDANGVMRMVEVEDGFAVPAGGDHQLARGGDHVMLMGLTRPLTQGDTVTLTLTFEQAGDVTVEVPVDNDRKADHSMMKHGS
ncbi:MAG: copper chaperone PCu(A)C [Marinibacterium sp.]